MTKAWIAFAVAGALAASPCTAAELLDDTPRQAARSAAVAGAYFRLALDRPAGSERAPKAGLRLAMTHDVRSPRAFSTSRRADVLELRLSGAARGGLYVAGRPVSGPEAERLNAAGESKGRLDKIMIGAGIALGAVAAFFLVSSVAG
ncbi:MAG TPA: hypothetical protein VF631_07240 [Allosphingosinicella sp.]|jgi:hypothetical protein|uniref:hypothetical protein n=1 Tax=Allosphingosinicella sp. TaxID=2823234 RepID=UPI002F2ADCBA